MVKLREHNITFYSQYADPPEIVKALNIHVSKKRDGKNCKESSLFAGNGGYEKDCRSADSQSMCHGRKNVFL